MRRPSTAAALIIATSCAFGCTPHGQWDEEPDEEPIDATGFEYPHCNGPTITHPGGKCSAHYTQWRADSGVATQAVVDCVVNSTRMVGGVVAFHSIDHGIELRWLDAHTLELGIPDTAFSQQWHDGYYYGYKLKYVYRPLQKSDPAYSGCGLKGAEAASDNSLKPKPLRGPASFRR